jgi:hypothetical protein
MADGQGHAAGIRHQLHGRLLRLPVRTASSRSVSKALSSDVSCATWFSVKEAPAAVWRSVNIANMSMHASDHEPPHLLLLAEWRAYAQAYPHASNVQRAAQRVHSDARWGAQCTETRCRSVLPASCRCESMCNCSAQHRLTLQKRLLGCKPTETHEQWQGSHSVGHKCVTAQLPYIPQHINALFTSAHDMILHDRCVLHVARRSVVRKFTGSLCPCSIPETSAA